MTSIQRRLAALTRAARAAKRECMQERIIRFRDSLATACEETAKGGHVRCVRNFGYELSSGISKAEVLTKLEKALVEFQPLITESDSHRNSMFIVTVEWNPDAAEAETCS